MFELSSSFVTHSDERLEGGHNCAPLSLHPHLVVTVKESETSFKIRHKELDLMNWNNGYSVDKNINFYPKSSKIPKYFARKNRSNFNGGKIYQYFVLELKLQAYKTYSFIFWMENCSNCCMLKLQCTKYEALHDDVACKNNTLMSWFYYHRLHW